MKKLITLLFLVSCINLAAQEKPVKEEIFVYVDSVATFPGGAEACRLFIEKNREMPEKAIKKGIKKGKVYVSMVVHADGTISDTKISRRQSDDHKVFDEEALRLVSIMPSWNPAIIKEKVVSSRLEVEIRFGY